VYRPRGWINPNPPAIAIPNAEEITDPATIFSLNFPFDSAFQIDHNNPSATT